MRLTILASVFTLLLPPVVLAAESDQSYRHLFTTTYANGATLDGTMDVGRTINCVRLAQPPETLDPNRVPSKSISVTDEIIFCGQPDPAMTAINHEMGTYGVMDANTITAMTKQRDEMMQSLGIQPGSQEEQNFTQAIGNAMGMMKQKQREALEQRMQDPDITDEERAELEAYMDSQLPDEQSPNAMALSSEITKTGKRGKQEGIPCVWYKHVISGLVQHITRVCAAAWEDVPGGKRTKEVFHGWYDFMDNLMKNSPIKNNAFDDFKKIDRFPLIRVTEDKDGNVRREERYMGTKNLKVSYVPPAEYTQESFGPMGKTGGVGPRVPSQPKSLSSSAKPKSPGGFGSTNLAPGECKKIPGEGIVCNNSPADETNLAGDASHSKDPNEQVEEMKSKMNELLEGMGLGGFLNQGE